MSQKPNIPVKKDIPEVSLDVIIDSVLIKGESFNKEVLDLLSKQTKLIKDVKYLLNIHLPTTSPNELIRKIRTDIIKNRELSKAAKLLIIRDYLQGLQALLEMKEWDILRLVMLNKENPVNEESS